MRRPVCRLGLATPRRLLPSGGFGFRLRLGALLDDLALEFDRVLGELRLMSLDEEIVEAAAMLDRPQRRRGDAQAHGALEQIRGERDLDEVRQEARARLAVGMADLVAGLNGYPSQLAAACHRTTILQTKKPQARTANMKAGRSNQEAPRLPLGLAKR